jgi:hypothetical protein
MGTVAKTCLPLYNDFLAQISQKGGIGVRRTYPSRHFVCPLWRELTVLAIELRESIEIVDKTDIVALHGNTGGDQHAPPDGFGVGFDAFPERHAMLLLRRRFGIVNDLGRRACRLCGITARVERPRWPNSILRLFGSHDASAIDYPDSGRCTR